jgi:hypothetical protein
MKNKEVNYIKSANAIWAVNEEDLKCLESQATIRCFLFCMIITAWSWKIKQPRFDVFHSNSGIWTLECDHHTAKVPSRCYAGLQGIYTHQVLMYELDTCRCSRYLVVMCSDFPFDGHYVMRIGGRQTNQEVTIMLQKLLHLFTFKNTVQPFRSQTVVYWDFLGGFTWQLWQVLQHTTEKIRQFMPFKSLQVRPYAVGLCRQARGRQHKITERRPNATFYAFNTNKWFADWH